MQTRRVIILGSTGSIGTQTLEVIHHLNGLARASSGHAAFEVVGLSAGSRIDLLAAQARRFDVGTIASAAPGPHPCEMPCKLLTGEHAAEELVRTVEADVVVAAIVGIAGLPATVAAVELGRDVALANKETLVAAGSLVTAIIGRSPPQRRARLLPVDSEHAGIWQCLLGVCGASRDDHARSGPPLEAGERVRKVTLTASGGPFRTWTKDAIRHATAVQALRHPTWTMGGKVTVDSASLMNKVLELVEAHWLFGVPAEKLDAVVHPQSIVHALVETAEGSVLAQLGMPDMRTPIQMALLASDRAPGLARSLDLAELQTLEFEAVDANRFPAISLWRSCLGKYAPTTRGAILNAANEEAVAGFLRPDNASIEFGDVVDVVMEAVNAISPCEIDSLQSVLNADRMARGWVRERLSGRVTGP